MKVLVYTHSMELGGSQLNAIELAAAVRDRGHDVVVYADEGALVPRLADLGLEHLPRRHSRLRPGVTTALDLARVVEQRGIEVIHGWEWPPILEGFAASALRRSTCVVGSIMSMSVAPFIPSGVPLTVGTERIRQACMPTRTGRVMLLEPPVDTDANRPDPPSARRSLEGVPEAGFRVLIVSRLAAELKLEGILTAIAATGHLAQRHDLQLVVVGDGPSRDAVAAAAAETNLRAHRNVVFLTGGLADPRAAYASADVCVGMGGSALRSLAFAKPLIVQGEGGFFEILTPDSAHQFFTNGWYGVSSRTPDEARDHLIGQFESLLTDAALRTRLGEFGRALVEERFSLRSCAAVLERFYAEAMETPRNRGGVVRDGAVSGVGLLHHKVARKLEQRQGRAPTDDFNARPV